jgi:hypothetical protein
VAKLWRSLLGRDDVTRYSHEEYLADLSSARNDLVVSYGSSAWQKTEDVENSFTGYVQQVYKSDGVVFAVMLARQLLFSEARFMWQELNDGRPGDLFWTSELGILDHPWPNATTGEMLARMDQDVSLAGNAYVVREEGRLRRLQPDWVTIVLTAPPAVAVRSDVVGYWYHPGRTYSNVDKPESSDEGEPVRRAVPGVGREPRQGPQGRDERLQAAISGLPGRCEHHNGRYAPVGLQNHARSR